MKGFDQKEKLALWISLLLHISCALFSIGYHYDDEHWQILEFANYKLGLSPAADLPWEFTDQIRPTLQPIIVIILAKAMMAINAYNPFTLAFILRLITGVLSWFATLLIIKTARNFFISNRNHFYFILLFANFLWFIPYIHVRYSGETWSGLFFFIGLYYLLDVINNDQAKNKILKPLFVGVCMGIAFWCRFQIVFAFLGIGLWILFFRYKSLIKFLPAIVSGILMLLLGVLLDHWFYNDWVFTPYTYFESNIINNVAARYGETPWWDYFSLFILQAGIPISIILLAFIVLSIVAEPKSPYAWVLIAFTAGHMLVGHKEMRFLFPMVYVLPLVSFQFLRSRKISYWTEQIPRPIITTSKVILISINLVLLIVASLIKPPAENVLLYSYVYSHSENKPVKLITLEGNPYTPGHLKVNFYKPLNFEIVKINKITELDQFIDRKDLSVFFFDDHFDLAEATKSSTNIRFDVQYRNMPAFFRNLNFNGWVDRQKIYCIYKLRK
jgi:phosphatidylinositol glycan class B